MLDNIMLGRYVESDSLLHKLDPRSKLLSVFLFFFIVFQASTFIDYTLLLSFLLILVIISKMGIKFFIKGITPMLFLIILTAFFQILFTPTGYIYFDFFILKVTDQGINGAITVTLRFIIIIGMSVLLSVSTNPLTLADAIEKLLSPLKKIKFPVHEIAMIFSIAMRFVPTILDETKLIMNAQRARGVDFNSGSLLHKFKSVIPILIPLFASALRRADELANAMESRGYRGDFNRTQYRQLKWSLNDSLVFVVLVLLAVLIIIF